VTITYVAYGGTGQESQIKAWQEPYTALNPHVTFANTSPPDPAQVKAQVEAGQVTWDMVTTAPYLANQNCGTLYEELNVPDLDLSQFDEGSMGKCHITDFRYALIFAYNADSYPDPAKAPSKVADYFDTKNFPGKRGIVPGIQDGILEWALMADGVAPADLYPLDIDRAFAKWDTVKADTIFAANPGALLEAMTSGQVDMWLQVSARSQVALDNGLKLTPVWDKTLSSADGIAIPKGSKNKEAVEKFMSFLVKPEQSQKMSELSGTAPANNLAKPNLPENGAKVNAFGEANTGERIPISSEYWSENFNTVSERFTTWLNG
jgi:putative spermidine/putrescine transport system substrate-binding protein